MLFSSLVFNLINVYICIYNLLLKCSYRSCKANELRVKKKKKK